MPMSVRGNSERGFTLVEMLVVLVVIGIGTAMVSLSIKPVSDQRLRGDAERLVNAFIAAQSEARSDGREIYWLADGQGWHFERRSKAAGAVDHFDGDDLLAAHRWGEAPMILSGQPTLPLVFDAEWIAAPLSLHLQAGGDSLTIMRDPAGQYAIR